MVSYKILVSVIFIISEDVPNVASVDTSEIKPNCANKLAVLHNVTDKLFTNLKLPRKFSKSVQQLLTMHKDVVRIVKNNYSTSKLKHDNDNTQRNIEDYDVVDEALKDANILLSYNATKVNKSFNKIIDNNLIIDVPGFLKQFLISLAPKPRNTIFDYANNSDTNTVESPKNCTKDLVNLYDPVTVPNQNNISIVNVQECSTNNTNPRLNFSKSESTSSNDYTNDTITQEISASSARKPLKLKTWVPAPDSKENITLDNRRIFRGNPTSIKKYPFVASIHVDDQFVCAGAIIWKNLVITAASCLQMAYVNRHRNPPSNVTIRIAGDSTTDGRLIPIARVYFNPYYNPDTLSHNLAILKMGSHKFVKKTVRKVLYDRSGDPFPNDVKGVKILGWGAKDENNNYPEKLSVSHLDIYDTEDCTKVYSKYYVSDSNFCAGAITTGSGACSKDVGDPAIINGVLVGMVSFGPPLCGTPDAPTVFTKIGFYATWLDSIIQRELQGTTHVVVIHDKNSGRSNKKHQRGKKVNPHHTKANTGDSNNDYPEEVLVLRELLKDIAMANQSKIEELIDEGFKKELLDINRFSNQKLSPRHESYTLEFTTDPYPYYRDFVQNSMTQKTSHNSIKENLINIDANFIQSPIPTGTYISSKATIFPHKFKLYKNHPTDGVQDTQKLSKMRDTNDVSNYDYDYSKETNKKPTRENQPIVKQMSNKNEYAKETTLKRPIFEHFYGSADEYNDKGLSIEVNTNRNNYELTAGSDSISKSRDNNLFFMFEASFEGPSILKKNPVQKNLISESNTKYNNDFDSSNSFRSNEEGHIDYNFD